MQDQTQVWRLEKPQQNLTEQCHPIHPIDFHLCSALKMPSAVWSLILLTMWLELWELGYVSRTRNGANGAHTPVSRWHKAVEVDGDFVEK
jgi:hypothetical protein